MQKKTIKLMSLQYKYEKKTFPDVLVITVEGSILEKNDTNEVSALIEESIEEGSNKVIMDLGGLDYMNSTGINVLISYLTKLRNDGGEFIITNVSEKVEQLLVITKLFSVFTVVASVEEGLNKFMQTQESN